MEKVMLIAGCSHAAGSEIDGTEDSYENRQQSFGNQLAYELGYRPVNIAQNGGTNSSIARSIVNWIENFYNPDTMDLFVLASWTESTRMEVPSEQIFWYEGCSTAPDWFDESSKHFYRINLGYYGFTPEEKELYSYFHKFIAQYNSLVEINTATNLLMVQYFLKSKNIKYCMCNTMHMFTLPDTHLELYTNRIDKTRYMDWNKNDKAFFWYYKNQGYSNPKAKYWHHDAKPHTLYCRELSNFIKENRCLL